MGLLDEAIREHLDLMRRHGANEAEVARREAEALGPVVREEEEMQESGSPSLAAEGEPALPYDRAAEAGLTGESDVPSFEWHGSSSGEPEVPSFVSPEPARHTPPEPDGAESQADAEVASEPTEMFEVVEGDPGVEETELSVAPPSAAEEPELSVEPGAPDEGGYQEGRSAELSSDPPVVPEPLEEAAAPEPEGSVDPAPPGAQPEPPEPEGSLDPAPGPEPGVAFEPPAEPALSEEQPIRPTVPTEAEDGFPEAPPHEGEAAFGSVPTEGDLAASPEPGSSEPVSGLGIEAAEEPALPPTDHEPPDDEVTAFHPAAVVTPEPPPADVEEVPPEPGPITPEDGPLTLDSEDLPPEREPPPLTAGEVVGEPPGGLGLGEPPIEDLSEPPIEEPPIEEPPIEEPPIEAPFVAGEEEAWREAGETPGGTSDALPEPGLGGASSPGDLDPYPAPPVEPDAVLEPADEPPLDERPLQGPAPDAELGPPDASPVEPLDAPADSPPPLPSDSEAARGFFDETAEHERPSREERPPTADPDFED